MNTAPVDNMRCPHCSQPLTTYEPGTERFQHLLDCYAAKHPEEEAARKRAYNTMIETMRANREREPLRRAAGLITCRRFSCLLPVDACLTGASPAADTNAPPAVAPGARPEHRQH